MTDNRESFGHSLNFDLTACVAYWLFKEILSSACAEPFPSQKGIRQQIFAFPIPSSGVMLLLRKRSPLRESTASRKRGALAMLWLILSQFLFTILKIWIVLIVKSVQNFFR